MSTTRIKHIVRGQFWTLWTPVTLSGLAIHFAGKIPAVARLRERRNAAADEAGMRQTTEMLVEQGKDPELVRQAMDEAISRAGDSKYSSSSAFRLVQALAEKENAPLSPPLTARRVPARAKQNNKPNTKETRNGLQETPDRGEVRFAAFIRRRLPIKGWAWKFRRLQELRSYKVKYLCT